MTKHNNLTPYHFNGKDIRVLILKDEPWWVATDVCRALGLVNSRDAVGRLELDEKGVAQADTPGGKQTLSIVNEPGLYALIADSKKKEAKKFRRWIFHEVLPQIRKQGAYIPQKLSRLQLINMAKDSELKRLALEKENKILAPKAAVHDIVSGSTGLVNMRDTAKLINMSPHTFTSYLRRDGYVFEGRNQMVPYQKHIDQGMFELKLVPARDGSKSTYRQTFITPFGVNRFRDIYNPDAPAPGPGTQKRIFA